MDRAGMSVQVVAENEMHFPEALLAHKVEDAVLAGIVDPEALEYKEVRRPIYPLDPEMSWSATDF